MIKKEKGLMILSQYFHPDLAATGQLLTELAEDIISYGYNIKVLTAKPSYYKNKEKYLKEEIYRGIEIYRVSATKFDKNMMIGRLCNFLSYLISVFSKLLFSKNKYPLLIVSNPPFLPLLGFLLKKVKNRRYIYLVHDIYPDIAIQLGYLKKNSIIVKIWNQIHYHVLKKAEKIIVLGDFMAEKFKEKYPDLDNNKIKIIHNWADEKKIFPIKKEENWFVKKYHLSNKIVILYSGNIGLFQDLKSIIKTAERLKNDDDILFLFIGNGGGLKELKRIVKKNNLTNVKFLPYQLKKDLSYSLSSADISIVTMEKGIEGLAVPSKLYGILASGRAVLGLVGKNCEVAEIIEDAKCGFRIDQGDVNKLVEQIKYIYNNPQALENMGKNSRQYFEKHFTRSKMTKKYYEVLEKVSIEGGKR
jgi:glycosyltransferase involved in cell wall biosynthesis